MPSDKQMPQYSEKYFDDTYEYRCVCLVSLCLGVVVLGGACFWWCLLVLVLIHPRPLRACRGLGNRPLREGGREGFTAIVRDVCVCVCACVYVRRMRTMCRTHTVGGWVGMHARTTHACERALAGTCKTRAVRFGERRLRLGSRISHTRVVFISAKRGQPRSYAYMFLAQPQQRITAPLDNTTKNT